MRRGLILGVLVLLLAAPASALAATGWMPIPAKFASKLRSTIVQPRVKAIAGSARITACSFQQRHRFYVCLFGTHARPKKGAVEVERTKRCDYVLFDVDLTKPASPKITRRASFRRCF